MGAIARCVKQKRKRFQIKIQICKQAKDAEISHSLKAILHSARKLNKTGVKQYFKISEIDLPYHSQTWPSVHQQFCILDLKLWNSRLQVRLDLSAVDCRFLTKKMDVTIILFQFTQCSVCSVQINKWNIVNLVSLKDTWKKNILKPCFSIPLWTT